MKVEWYLRTDLRRKDERQGTGEASSTMDALRKVLEAHAEELAGKPFCSICIHVMPAQSEHSYDSRKEGA